MNIPVEDKVDISRMVGQHRAAMIQGRAQPRGCPDCRGCGRLADGDEQEPWTGWETLPRGSDLAVRLGAVKPILCPKCEGTGYG